MRGGGDLGGTILQGVPVGVVGPVKRMGLLGLCSASLINPDVLDAGLTVLVVLMELMVLMELAVLMELVDVSMVASLSLDIALVRRDAGAGIRL